MLLKNSIQLDGIFSRGDFGGDKKNIHWISWDMVLALKNVGGLGLGSLKAQNITLIMN